MRRWWRRLLDVITLVGGIVGVAWAGIDWGWWAWTWRWWIAFWAPLLVASLVGLMVVTARTWAASWPRPDSRAPMCLGTAVVVSVGIMSLRMERWPGSLSTGFTFSTVVMGLWACRWNARRRLQEHVNRREALVRGLCAVGWPVVTYAQRVVGRIAEGPSGRVRPERSLRGGGLPSVMACVAGLAIVVVVWGGTAAAVALAGSAAAEHVNPTEQAPASEAAPSSPSEPPPTEGGTAGPGQPVAEPEPEPEEDGRGGALRCTHDPASGSQVDQAALEVARQVMAEVSQRFHVCAIGELTWQASIGMYRQPIFTVDGSGAALLVSERPDGWAATFVTSDEGAAYDLIPNGPKEWVAIGFPLPFVPCGEVTVQPFVGPGDRIEGVGIRIGPDVEGQPNRPVFSWGATIEGLIDAVDELRMPGDHPPAQGGVQYFEGVAVPSFTGPAKGLDIGDLMSLCR